MENTPVQRRENALVIVAVTGGEKSASPTRQREVGITRYRNLPKHEFRLQVLRFIRVEQPPLQLSIEIRASRSQLLSSILPDAVEFAGRVGLRIEEVKQTSRFADRRLWIEIVPGL